MWAFNNLPRAEIKRRYGFEVTDDWVQRVQSATVRFPNGTGSFVSSEGLVLTNYHIVEDIVGELSTAERDLAKTGFVAHTRASSSRPSSRPPSSAATRTTSTSRATASTCRSCASTRTARL